MTAGHNVPLGGALRLLRAYSVGFLCIVFVSIQHHVDAKRMINAVRGLHVIVGSDVELTSNLLI
jgi:hypothetical protein